MLGDPHFRVGWHLGSAVAMLLCLSSSLALPAAASPSAIPLSWSTTGGLESAPGQSAGSPAQAVPPQQDSKSSYDDPQVMGGSKTVGDQLVQDDARKKPLFDISLVPGGFYALKRRIKERTGVEVNVDYNLLNQYASYSSTDRQASSGSLRFYGQWTPAGDESPRRRALVFRIETRHVVWE